MNILTVDNQVLHVVPSKTSYENDIEVLTPTDCVTGFVEKFKVTIKTIEFTESVRFLGQDAFYFCPNLEYVSTKNIEEAGMNVFCKCVNLKSVDLCGSLSVIEDGMFADCHSLIDVSLPESIKKINESAFENCRSLRSINLPSGLEFISESAFSGCPGLLNEEFLSSIPDKFRNIIIKSQHSE